jgi:hypothetical protein
MKKLLVICAFVFGWASLKAQSVELLNQVVGPGGNYIQNSNVALSITLGETIFKSHAISSVVMVEGFEHYNENSLISVLEAKERPLVIYPNPASDYLSIESNEAIGIIQLVNQLGQEVLSLTTLEERATISVSSLSKGIYYIQLTHSGKFHSRKIVKL